MEPAHRHHPGGGVEPRDAGRRVARRRHRRRPPAPASRAATRTAASSGPASARCSRSTRSRTISWRTVPTKLRYRDSTIWTYELEPTERGCRITQRFEVVQLGPLMDRLFYAAIPAHRDRSAALADDVRRLGEHAATLVPRDGRARAPVRVAALLAGATVVAAGCGETTDQGGSRPRPSWPTPRWWPPRSRWSPPTTTSRCRPRPWPRAWCRSSSSTTVSRRTTCWSSARRRPDDGRLPGRLRGR